VLFASCSIFVEDKLFHVDFLARPAPFAPVALFMEKDMGENRPIE
jgi:hypothetical protein